MAATVSLTVDIGASSTEGNKGVAGAAPVGVAGVGPTLAISAGVDAAADELEAAALVVCGVEGGGACEAFACFACLISCTVSRSTSSLCLCFVFEPIGRPRRRSGASASPRLLS